MNIMKEAPAGAATPIAGAGTNPYTDCITIPLEEYKKTLEMATELGIIRELAGDQNVYLILAKSQPDSMVPMAEYESLQNTMAIKIKHLEDELKTKTSIIESLTNSQTAGHICPVCERVFYEEPAISRRDPDLKICSVCATTEALEDAQAAGAISKGDANEILEIVEEAAKTYEPEEMMEDVPAGEEEEMVPRPSTPEQCSKDGKKTQRKKNKAGVKADLPMEEIMMLKEEGWSNVKIAKKYDVTDVTIGSRIKSYLAEKKATVEMIRKLREEGWTYEKIEDVHGIPEEKIREMLREAGKAERGENNG